MLGCQTEIDLGYNNSSVMRDKAAHSILEGRGPSSTVDVTPAVSEDADGKARGAFICVGRRVDTNKNPSIGDFLIYGEISKELYGSQCGSRGWQAYAREQHIRRARGKGSAIAQMSVRSPLVLRRQSRR